MAGAARYLRSIGVDPRGVVLQRGGRNYAGPACPGAGWTCTSTAHPVVQIGGKNTFSCAGNCAVVQIARPAKAAGRHRSLTAAAAADNVAKCVKTTGLSQSCTISQSSTSSNNVAIVYQSANKTSGLTQTASYAAQITQQATGASNANTACLFQAITIDGSTVAKNGVPVTVTLDAHQSASITQNAHGGNNTIENATSGGGCDASNPLTQTQTLTSTAKGSGSVTQNQNATDGGANVLLDIEQNQGAGFIGNAGTTGANTAPFTQTSGLTSIAATQAGPVSQTQSSPSGGILATVNQFSNGVSTANAMQTETQCEDAEGSTGPLTCPDTPQQPPAYALTQTQFGPVAHTGRAPKTARTLAKVGKGPCPPSCSTQTGNAADTFTINQSSTQNNDTGQGQTNFISGDCATSGNCTVTQNTNVDGVQSTNTQSGSNVNTQTNCSGSSCTSSGPTSSGTLTMLPNGLSVTNTDVAEFGYGGMRGIGTGTVAVSGVTGPVTHAFLYWNGPTNSADPASNAAVSFAGTPITGTNIGTASDNCWGFQNSQSYRADVTSLVTGNGTYSLAGFTKADADINGVSLLVFYSDANSGNDRSVVLWNGNDSNIPSTFEPAGWDETISGVPYPGSGAAKLDFVAASDGQTAFDDEILVNGQSVVPVGPTFSGDSTPHGAFDASGDLWDVKTGLVDITSFLTQGSNNSLHLTSGAPGSDCVSLVVVAANVPAH